MPDGEVRGLPAVLSADAVDVGRLVEQDPVDAPQRLDAYRAAIAEIVGCHGGRPDPAADGIVAAYEDAESAVMCACEIQEALASRNAVLHRDRRLFWRIGVALADAEAAGLAASLRDIAGPGEICISGAVRDEIAHRPDIDCAFDGERALPDAPAPVRVYRLRPTLPAPAAGGDIAKAVRNADRAYRLLAASLVTAVAAVLAAILVAATAGPAAPDAPPAEGTGWDVVPAVLGLASTVAAAAAVVLAYGGRSATAVGGTWVDGHFRFLIRTFWIALGAQLVGVLTAAVVVGIVVLAVLPVWVVLRCRRGRALLRRGAAHPDPRGWGFG